MVIRRMMASTARVMMVALVVMGVVIGSGMLAGRSAAARQNIGGYLTTSNTYLRVKPNSKSAAVVKLKAGSLVVAGGPLAGKKDGAYRWVYVTWIVGGDMGMANGWAIASKLTRFSYGDGNAVTTANLNLRAAPSKSSEVYLVIPNGAGVNVLDWTPENGYVKVEYSWTEGYVYAEYLGDME